MEGLFFGISKLPFNFSGSQNSKIEGISFGLHPVFQDTAEFKGIK